MSWKDTIKKNINAGLTSGEMQLSQDTSGNWILEPFMRGAATTPYSEAHMNNAIQQIGSTWDKVNTNSNDGKALEVYLNRNNGRYALSADDRTEFLREFGASI
mgnify:FL=1|tara:strand:+ start:288 stop:596 length:309 start_codon:yes stop_codon:yes gene_type:complete